MSLDRDQIIKELYDREANYSKHIEYMKSLPNKEKDMDTFKRYYAVRREVQDIIDCIETTIGDYEELKPQILAEVIINGEQQ